MKNWAAWPFQGQIFKLLDLLDLLSIDIKDNKTMLYFRVFWSNGTKTRAARPNEGQKVSLAA